MCIFCKIINSEIPSYKVYEDENVLAFLDVAPCTKGHTVVIPKKHGETIFDFDDENLSTLFPAIKKVSQILTDKLNVSDFTIGINHGAIAGQAVPHLHIHIIPRYTDDGGGNMHSIVKQKQNLTIEELSKLF
jgi:histidine triad (HIT) family protein